MSTISKSLPGWPVEAVPRMQRPSVTYEPATTQISCLRWRRGRKLERRRGPLSNMSGSLRNLLARPHASRLEGASALPLAKAVLTTRLVGNCRTNVPHGGAGVNFSVPAGAYSDGALDKFTLTPFFFCVAGGARPVHGGTAALFPNTAQHMTVNPPLHVAASQFTVHVILIGMAPRKSGLPISTPQWRRMS